MVEFRWIQMFLYLILVLQFTAVSQHLPLSFMVRVGDEVTLPCEHMRNDQHTCDSTTWAFSRFSRTAAVDVAVGGQIVERAKVKRDRLSITENCSLVVKNVTDEDTGRYFCIQSNRYRQSQVKPSLDLSVVTMTEHEDADTVTFKCSVSTYGQCAHKVKWLYKDNKDLKTSQSYCSANVTFMTSRFIYTSKNYELLKCNVTDGYVFTLKPHSSGEKTARWWLYIIVAVGLTAFLITVVALIRWKRNKGNKTQKDENMADPGDGVSYASIRYTKKTNSKAQVRGGEDAVTYSTVKALSSAGASAEPSHLYATVNNKPNK